MIKVPNVTINFRGGFILITYFCLTSRYASTVMEVYKVNEELNKQLKEVSTFTAQFTAEAGFNQNPEVGSELS